LHHAILQCSLLDALRDKYLHTIPDDVSSLFDADLFDQEDIAWFLYRADRVWQVEYAQRSVHYEVGSDTEDVESGQR
jgi:hypothetical protein